MEMTKKNILTIMCSLLLTSAMAVKKSIFLYAGQSNADGREYVQNLPEYMKTGTSPYCPYTHLRWANICGRPTTKVFRYAQYGQRRALCFLRCNQLLD